MSCDSTVVEHCLATSTDLPLERRVVLLRSLAVLLTDRQLSARCRSIAAELETAQRSQEQLLLNLRTKAA